MRGVSVVETFQVVRFVSVGHSVNAVDCARWTPVFIGSPLRKKLLRRDFRHMLTGEFFQVIR